MHDALAMVRRELGPDAAVLHTREVRTNRLFGLLAGPRLIEVTASTEVNVPSRLPARQYAEQSAVAVAAPPVHQATALPAAVPSRRTAERPVLNDQVQGQLAHLQTMVKELCRRSQGDNPRDLPQDLFRLFTDLIDSDLSEELARELVERVRSQVSGAELSDLVLLKARIARMIEPEIPCTGSILVTPGQCRVAALVGPTGVGKTTTIAKLAANFRLKEKRRVGLITVDTYRIAAVEQLADLRRHHRSADARRLVAAGDARGREAAGRSRPDPHGHRRTQPEGRSQNSGTAGLPARGPGRRGASRSQQRGRRANIAANGRAIRHRGHDGADPHEIR